MTNNQLVASRVKYHRERCQMSQQELADHLGVSKSSVCSLESGNLHITVDHLITLSEVFEIRISELLRSLLREF